MRKSRLNIQPHFSQKKSAFTLIEVLIVLVVAAILIGVLFQTYRTISDVSLRVRYEKNIGNKVVQVQTILQNILDTTTIDYGSLSTYTKDGRSSYLPLKKITGETGAVMLTEGGEIVLIEHSGDDTRSIPLLGDDYVVSQGAFFITPLDDPTALETQFNEMYQPGVWIVGNMVARAYTGMVFPINTFYTFIQK